MGIHGQELPKFRDGSQEWWVPSHGSALIKSRVELIQKNKGWAKDDLMRINEHQDEPAPEDCFKKGRVLKLKKREVAAKITGIEVEIKESKA